MLVEPTNFTMEQTTVWSFPNRGKWATHSGVYRGNWSPYVPRNLILRYSNPNEWVLDQFSGGGTTLVEARLLNRNAIGIDINQQALNTTKENLLFKCEYNPEIIIKRGDAQSLCFIDTNSIDLICTHPPYANIIQYSDSNPQDISLLGHEKFLRALKRVADESYRVLKAGKICAIMMGDMRKNGNVIPLGMESMEVFLEAGFRPKEIIIKEQHNCKATDYWIKQKRNFLLLAHEYIFVLQK